MKVVTPQQMSAIEISAFKQGFSDSDFMEEAGSGVALVVQDYVEKYDLDHIVYLLCGKGNNAGDAYVAGIHLLHLDFKVFAIQVEPIENCRPLCKQSYERFMNEGGEELSFPKDFFTNGILVDGLFGTGFKGEIKEPYAQIIRQANASKLPIISIDIPSGLNGETGEVSGEAIIAKETAFLGLPKLGFFLNEGWNHVGKLRYVDFGLPKELADTLETELVMPSVTDYQAMMPTIKRCRHKYERGYVVALAGSQNYAGAAVLSCTSALRGGAGIVRLFHPEGLQFLLTSCPDEIIRNVYSNENDEEMIAQMNKASAVFIGPGIGKSDKIKQLLKTILPQLDKPCILDADALTILSEEEIILPKETILTPHLGEMSRLLKLTEHPQVNFHFLNQCRDFASQKNVTLVLKGAPTFIIKPGEIVLVNSSGDPGMATAGSGDVLTGLITALASQGLNARNAASLGVYLHGLAGEHAADEMTSYGMIASDITYHFPEAFKFYTL